tara:strand:+ start:335 stop:499 length:165 start_codon:yes stop_codon:yes gene_type:complete
MANKYTDNYKTDEEGIRWVKLTLVNPYIYRLIEAEKELERLRSGHLKTQRVDEE